MRNSDSTRRTFLVLVFLTALGVGAAEDKTRDAADPARYWSFEKLSKTPRFRPCPFPESRYPGMRALMVEGVGPEDSQAEFFAYYAVPDGKSPKGGWPGVLLVHGGGGTAFPNYVEDWKKLGFAVLTFDYFNQRPAPGLTNVPPCEVTVPRVDLKGGYRKHHLSNVANAVVAHSLLRSFPEVNPNRTVFVGLSWGSWYGTCLAAVDGRFKGGVEIYCGDRNPLSGSCELVDGRFLPVTKVPLRWTVGTNDQNASPYTQNDGFAACGKLGGLTIVNKLPHSHAGFIFDSVQRNALHFVGLGKGLPVLGEAVVFGGKVRAPILDPGAGISHAKLGYTCATDSATWKRPWKYAPAKVVGRFVVADIPDGTVQCYLAAFEGDARYHDLCGTTKYVTLVETTHDRIVR